MGRSKFNFIINSLAKIEDNGDIKQNSVGYKITVFNRLGTEEIATSERTITGKTSTPFKFNVRVNIPSNSRSTSGYKFTIEKTTDDDSSSKVSDDLRVIGWNEIENSPQSYPRTAVIGYALKVVDEHQGGAPNFTSLVKGLLVKVPSNYNQPVLDNGKLIGERLKFLIQQDKVVGINYKIMLLF